MEKALRVELFDTTDQTNNVLINALLVDEGFAVKCEEPYLSRVTLNTRHSLSLSPSLSSLSLSSLSLSL